MPRRVEAIVCMEWSRAATTFGTLAGLRPGSVTMVVGIGLQIVFFGEFTKGYAPVRRRVIREPTAVPLTAEARASLGMDRGKAIARAE